MILVEDVIYILLKYHDNVMNTKFLCIPSATILSTGDYCRELRLFKKYFLLMCNIFTNFFSFYATILVNLILSMFSSCNVSMIIHSLLQADTFITESLFSPLRITFNQKEIHVSIITADVGHFH